MDKDKIETAKEILESVTGFLGKDEKKTPNDYYSFLMFISDIYLDDYPFVSDMLIGLNDPNISDFFVTAASTKYHGACQCGLVRHSLTVYKMLLKFYISFEELHEFDLKDIFIAAIFHDICKCGMYKYNEKDEKWELNRNYHAIGHGVQSIHLLIDLFYNSAYSNGNRVEDLLPIEAIRWHMGLYDLSDYDKRFYDEAKRRNKLVLALHYADDLASSWENT